MNNYLKKDNLFCIIPHDFDDCAYIKFKESLFDELIFESKKTINKNNDDEVEFFSNGQKGVLYFRTKIVESKKNFIKVKMPEHYEIIQRRENERIVLNKEISLADGDNTYYNVLLKDLSIGGIKILSNKELCVNNKYTVFLNFDNLNLKFSFIPSRVTKEKEEFLVSGKIDTESSTEKIELVQYCYRKIFEQSNRN